VARLADLHTFVTTQLPQGYDTPVGEGGVSLSGGQRQRIAIARALYRNPTLLVFDEATNSLDPETEAAVLGAIARLTGQLTLVLIAHRHSTLRGCDTILRMDAGRLRADSHAAYAQG
jgi:ABC-type bacteriocin/lantibiotic exporter with double-glycine peptidase domain